MSIRPSSFPFKPSPAFVTLSLLLLVLWFAGGGSRGDIAGQGVVRAAAFLALIVVILFGRRSPTASTRPALIFVGIAIAITAIQLLPLPPGLWQALPGRQFIDDAADGGTAGAWRSWSLVPGATINALGALVVPLAVLVAMTALSRDEKTWLPGFVLILVAASTLLGLLQFSGAGIDNPLVNDLQGVVSGTFTNRNHFALLLALGCLLIPVWMLREGHRLQWRGPVGLGLLLLFMLTILATGSRGGMAIGALAIVIAGVIARRGLRRGLRHTPRWVLPAIFAAVIALLAAFVLVSVAADRAASIQRSFSVDVEQDMRSRAFPTVWEMTRDTFPAGSGLGGFDPLFRVYEPFDLLKPTDFNHAHNDFIEVVLGAGLPGLLLLLAALVWWGRASIIAWRSRAHRQSMLPRLGSAMILLVMIASAFDYPARTPLIMAMMALAAVWLSSQSDEDAVSALPRSDQHL